MTPDAQLRFSVYQEGQRAFRSGTTCPYTDWRAKTWAKGFAAAKAYFSETQREAPEPPTPERTGVGELCAPGPAAEQAQRWMLVFEDADRAPVTYSDEDAARRSFAMAEALGWNCCLWQLAPRYKRPNA